MDKRERVLLIGNGPSANEYDVGDAIDQFEGLVVRINWAEIAGFEKKVGTRTDVWATCLAQTAFDPFERFDPGVVMATVPYTSNGTAQQVWNSYVERTRGTDVELWDMNWDRWHSVRNQVGHWPSSGALAAYYFMDRDFDLHIHGFDHFRGEDHHYYDPEHGFRRDHSTDKEFAFFAKYAYLGRLRQWDLRPVPAQKTVPKA